MMIANSRFIPISPHLPDMLEQAAQGQRRVGSDAHQRMPFSLNVEEHTAGGGQRIAAGLWLFHKGGFERNGLVALFL
ncbi:hypothetical protein ACFL0Q_02045 [Thermodesulfobacteriota bacterium]